MDYSGPPNGARRRNCYDGTYYSETPGGAYSLLLPTLPPSSCPGFPLSRTFPLPPVLGDCTGNEILTMQLPSFSLRTLSGSSRTRAGLQFPVCSKALSPWVTDLSTAQLHTLLPLPAQNPGPGRVPRCRASTACPASWSASPPTAPPHPRFCWRMRRRSLLPAHRRKPPRARSSAAPPPLPRTLPRSAPRAQTPTPSTRCSEGVGGPMGGLRCPRARGTVPLESLAPER